MSDAELIDALGAQSGIVCAVGAGGKKTTLYRLLRAHPGRVACTATTFILAFPDDLPAHVVTGQPDRVVADVFAAAGRYPKIAYAGPPGKPGRYVGVPAAEIARCHREGHFDLTLVKADGARMRLAKAPADGEPDLVPGATTVLGLVSAHVFGLPLSPRHVHRPEHFAAVTGARPDEAIAPRHVAKLIASPDGFLRGVGDARVVPVINMADSDRYRAAALEAARLALALSDRYDRVVVAAMREANPIVEVVRRPDA